ncbi:SMAD/FHA domain-containing protein [Piromyces finnis]|uniref:SMAD/FHA domain-containing protein n=1 Tax=Piromyces finnis TaxID=1754191 RepID=A0A1Y1V951_9FUNG|nr:SMAD/FHA domain-containing protein [Piromyces finnis]|eukprot:ORX50279.1 SMAD/FHA domain-containing protein [Piromyces finnis]
MSASITGNPLSSYPLSSAYPQNINTNINGNNSNNCNIMLITLNSSSKKKKIINLENPIHIGRAVDNTAMTAAASSSNLNGIFNGTEASSSSPSQFIYYSSKVVSRNHALLKHENGKFYIKDTGSSSGTFLNGKRLSPQGQESTFFELNNGDVVKLGEDCQVNKVLHKCVLLKIITSTIGIDSSAILDDMDYLDFTLAPEVRASVQNEFDSIWKSLTEGMVSPKEYLFYLKNSLFSSSENEAKNKVMPNSLDEINANTNIPGNQSNTTEKYISSSKSVQNLNQASNPTYPNKNSSYNSKKSIESALNELEDLLTDNQKFKKQISSKIPDNSHPSQTTNPTKSISTERIQNCINFIMSNSWQSPDIQQTLLKLAQDGDRQLLSYYENLKQFPQVFINITTKYVEELNTTN